MVCARDEATNWWELCNEASVWMWIWPLACLSDALLNFSGVRRSGISVALSGFWRRFKPAGQREVSFSSELCSLNRKQCGSKRVRRISAQPSPHSPKKSFSDVEMCAQPSVSAKNGIMSGSCRNTNRGDHHDDMNTTINGSNFFHNISGCGH